jgi:hypothetical protein
MGTRKIKETNSTGTEGGLRKLDRPLSPPSTPAEFECPHVGAVFLLLLLLNNDLRNVLDISDNLQSFFCIILDCID